MNVAARVPERRIFLLGAMGGGAWLGIESSSVGAGAGGAQALGAPKWDPNRPRTGPRAQVSVLGNKYKCPRWKWAKNIGLGAMGS